MTAATLHSSSQSPDPNSTSTSSAVRSRSSSRVPSPVSPGGADASGLSRRHSWNQQDEMFVQGGAAGLGGAAYAGYTGYPSQTGQIGQGGQAGVGGQAGYTRYAGHTRSASSQPTEEHDIGLSSYPNTHRPAPSLSQSHRDRITSQYQNSLSSSSGNDDNDNESFGYNYDRGHMESNASRDSREGERLTSTLPLAGSSALPRRTPSRVYDANGHARGMGSSIAGAVEAVGRSPAFRSVSATFRRASVRVTGMLGDKDGGRVRLVDQDRGHDRDGLFDNEDGKNDAVHLKTLGPSSSPEEMDSDESDGKGSGPQPNQTPMPPSASVGRLRGKTMGIFGPNSKIRIACDNFLAYT